ncbi:MAG TPA: hypothetical protein VH186_01160 [Chloroflexia bacterium]|nr:hypothetical protein [Chloroflexia bacterium]
MAKVSEAVAEKPLEIRHEKCGGVYLAAPGSEVGANEDCPVCTDVRRSYVESGGLANRATPGTPLAAELGLVVISGKPGPVNSQAEASQAGAGR